MCSNGQDGGFAGLAVDGKVIAKYRGLGGFAEGAVFAAYGLYRVMPLNIDDVQHLKFEGCREGGAA